MARIFCCNYLNEVDELIKENIVDVDYVKFPSINTDQNAFEKALKIKPVIFHGFAPFDSKIADNKLIDNFSIEKFREILNKTNASYMSGHITAMKSDYPEYVNDDEEYKKVILQNAIKNVNFLKENLDIPIALENIVYSPDGQFIKCVTDTDFISNLIYDTDSYFLFDTSHARVAAYFRNMSFEKYLEGLPLDRLYEVHLSGTIMDEGMGLTAPHTKMNQEDYELLEYLLKNTPVKVITLEYGPVGIATYDAVNPKIKQEFIEQILRIKEIIKKYE